jgi:hypothetical protein
VSAQNPEESETCGQRQQKLRIVVGDPGQRGAQVVVLGF